MKQYKNILFDLDGTLLNTLEDLCDSLNYALTVCGYPARTIEQTRSFVGSGTRTMIIRAIPGGERDPLLDRCTEIFGEHYNKNSRNKTDLYPGIREMLTELHQAGYRMAVVTNKLQSAVDELWKIYFSGTIEIAVGDEPPRRVKPAPDGVLVAMKVLGANTEDTVYIGDSEVDVATAKNAALTMIGVSWGFRTVERLKEEGAQYIINKPEQLADLLKRLNGENV